MSPMLYRRKPDGSIEKCSSFSQDFILRTKVERNIITTPWKHDEILLDNPDSKFIVVSTVFLSIDHSFGRTGPPVLWETMVWGDPRTGFQKRYTSEKDALMDHMEIVKEQHALLNRIKKRKSTRRRRSKIDPPEQLQKPDYSGRRLIEPNSRDVFGLDKE